VIAVIDNYDSFTYNLVQYLWELGADVQVYRNDAIAARDLAALRPAGVVISPGPGTPEHAGVTLEVIQTMQRTTPILGVCLGHQAIAHAAGAKVVHAPRLMHGKVSSIHHDGQGVFHGVPSPFSATRYHSLIVDATTLPQDLVPTAWTDERELMGLRHVDLPLEGVQFHPESFLTEHGRTLLQNFLHRTTQDTR
jgi:anthranilate synthase/aminodeoxychorismate synthase-like glutamine amidotransferase